MPETVVPVMFFLIVVGLPITAGIISRVLAHQERMEMLRHGIVPPPDPRAMRNAMKYGTKPDWTPGATTVPPPGWTPHASYDPAYHAQCQLRRGIQVACIGFALLIGLSFIGFHDGRYVYGPWLLGGLIPMFVGIAQIISAVLSGAQFGPGAAAMSGGRFGPADRGAASPPPSGAGPIPPTAGSYGGWRPGSIPEIEKPAGPPDRTS